MCCCTHEEETDQKALPVRLKNSWGELLGCMGLQDGPGAGVSLLCESTTGDLSVLLPLAWSEGKRCRGPAVSCYH